MINIIREGRPRILHLRHLILCLLLGVSGCASATPWPPVPSVGFMLARTPEGRPLACLDGAGVETLTVWFANYTVRRLAIGSSMPEVSR